MSEGARFPWKLQNFRLAGPVADYSNLSKPLPPPPAGMTWKKEGRDWRLAGKDEEPELMEEKDLVLENVPSESTTRGVGDDEQEEEEEWELLSDRQRASVRSATTTEEFVVTGSSVSSHTLSVPFKIQRTASNSTIDSSDGQFFIGPTGQGVLGVDYVEHVVLPTDTLQGICLAYKISSTRLKQANHFSGNSLSLAPKKLVIPISKAALRSGFIRVQDTDAKEYKMHAFCAEYPDMSIAEAKAYLELADWELKAALKSAKDDKEWENEIDSNSLKSGEIRVKVNMDKGRPVGLVHQGAGIPSPRRQKKEEEAPKMPKEKPKVTPVHAVPAIATKSVQPKDILQAASQHNNFGVELQSFNPPNEP